MQVDAQTRAVSTAIQSLERNSDFEVVMSRLVALADKTDDYNDEFLPADIGSITKAIHLVYSAALRLGAAFPGALVGPNGTGGLRIEWRKPKCAVMLIVSSQRCEIFHSFDGQHDIEPATDKGLAQWLRDWLRVSCDGKIEAYF